MMTSLKAEILFNDVHTGHQYLYLHHETAPNECFEEVRVTSYRIRRDVRNHLWRARIWRSSKQ